VKFIHVGAIGDILNRSFAMISSEALALIVEEEDGVLRVDRLG
jgi:hypothetical protein